MVFPGGYDQCCAISTPCEVLQDCEDHSIPIPGKSKNTETICPQNIAEYLLFPADTSDHCYFSNNPASLCHSWLLEKRYPDAK